MNTLTNLPADFLTLPHQAFSQQELLSTPEDCWAYGYDNSRLHRLPQAVVFPTTHEQVVSEVQACYQFGIALTVRGHRIGTTGATVPLHHGVVMSLERMTKVLAFSPDNRYITVQMGLTNQQVQDLVETQGFLWPPDPTSAPFCSIGGNLAYNSAGFKAVRYAVR